MTETNLALHQTRAWKDDKRFQVRVWHRRAGKTYYTILRQLVRLFQEGQGDWQSFYVAPTRTQAKQIAWPYLADFAVKLGGELMVSELKVIIPGKGFIQLQNGEQFDRMRGLYMDDCTIDEAADVPVAAYTEVISPAISDRKGRLTFMGTPRGKLNLLWKAWEWAASDPDNWSRSRLAWNETGMVENDEIERNRRQQSEAQFKQEWECSWSGATPGAYFGQAMTEVEDTGRVCPIKFDASLRTVAALDLGHHDLMPVIFAQEHGTEKRIINCRTYQFTSLPDMVQDMRKNLDYFPDLLIVPHDANVTELGTGKTRVQTLRDLGLNVTVAPRLSIDEGIEQTRHFLSHCWFDRENTEFLREGLSQYRSDYDELRGVFRLKPIHDQASHYADAMRYLAIGNRTTISQYGPRPKLKRGTAA